MELEEKYVGDVFTVEHCSGAIDSYQKALQSVPAGRRGKFTRALILQIQRLANGKRMSKDSFPAEGNLPNNSNPGGKSKPFFALKRIPIRGYCWFSNSYKSTYFISHYIAKKKNKLDTSDTTKVHKNWTQIEVNHYEP